MHEKSTQIIFPFKSWTMEVVITIILGKTLTPRTLAIDISQYRLLLRFFPEVGLCPLFSCSVHVPSCKGVDISNPRSNILPPPPCYIGKYTMPSPYRREELIAEMATLRSIPSLWFLASFCHIIRTVFPLNCLTARSPLLWRERAAVHGGRGGPNSISKFEHQNINGGAVRQYITSQVEDL
jgi:hypothetical protein